MTKDKNYLTSSQIAKRLRISITTVYRYIRLGMPYAKVGQYRFDSEAVDRWFEEFCNSNK